MTVDWTTLVKRRKINVPKWLKNNNVSNYVEFIDLLKAIGVEPIPREGDVSHLFPKEVSHEEKKLEEIFCEKEDLNVEKEDVDTHKSKLGRKKHDKKFPR